MTEQHQPKRAVLVDLGLRRCGRCGAVKSLERFTPNRSKAGGYSYVCLKCEPVATERELRNDRIAKRRKKTTPDGAAAVATISRRSVKRWRATNPKKVRAALIVGRAIVAGALTRKPCEVCGAAGQAHHDDYDKPLDVRWLCLPHHRAWHRLNGPGANGDVTQEKE